MHRRWKRDTIASTTENPYFYIYNALLSRQRCLNSRHWNRRTFRPVEAGGQAFGEEDQSPVNIPEDALDYLAQSAGGDMRKALGCLEFAVAAAEEGPDGRHVTLDMVQQVAKRTAMRYDRKGMTITTSLSAYQKIHARL